MTTTAIKSLFAASTTPALAISAAHTAELNGDTLLAVALADHCRMLKCRAAGDVAGAVEASRKCGSALRILMA